MADRQVAIVTPDAAKARALAILKQHAEAVSFVRTEDLETQGMFLPVVSVIPATPDDFHVLGGGQCMPKKHQVDRMGEAAGVNVTSVDVEHPSRYVWVGKAHGTKRMPDGSMREGESEYEFDAEAYAELDFLKDAKAERPRYTNDVAKRQHLLEYAKFGRQRASTGSRLALIRYFCKCPTSFSRDQLPRAMAFARVDLNTDGLLQAPEMREAAIAHAVGATSALFGPGQPTVRNVTPTEPAKAPLGGESAEPDPFADDAAQPTPVVDAPSPEEEAKDKLRDWLNHDAVKAHQKAPAAVAALIGKQDATLGELEAMIEKCRKLEARAAGGAT